MIPPPRLALLAGLFAACVPLPSDPSAAAPPSTPVAAELAVLGVNGRLVADDGAYWIPLDAADRQVPLGVATREALALVNTGGSALTIDSLWLTPLGDTVAGELALLAPTRAAAVPLDASGVQLAPGERLDFDVAVRPRASGVRRARLTARWVEGPDLRVELRARVEGDLRLHDAEWPTWPAPSWSVAGPEADGLRVDASALHRDNLYLAGRGSAASDLLVARVAPEGALQWVTALTGLAATGEAGSGGPAAVTRGLCVGGAGVGVVGDRGPANGAPDALIVTWLGRDGALAWRRAWSDESGVRGAACVAGDDHLWVVGVAPRAVCDPAGGCVAAPEAGAEAERSELLVAAFAADGEPLGTWSLSPGDEGALTVAAAIAGRGGGLIVGGRLGDLGYVARLEDGALDVWHTFAGPVMALSPLERVGWVAVASRLDDGIEIAAVDAGGDVVWRRAVYRDAGLEDGPDGGLGHGLREGVDADGVGAVALASANASLFALIATAPGVAVLELEGGTGAPLAAAQLVVPGSPHVSAASAAGAGLRFALAGVGLLGGDEAWYQAAPPEVVVGAEPVVTFTGAIAARDGTLWRDTTAHLQAWDAAADAVTRPLDALGDAPADLVVTGLPRPDSG